MLAWKLAICPINSEKALIHLKITARAITFRRQSFSDVFIPWKMYNFQLFLMFFQKHYQNSRPLVISLACFLSPVHLFRYARFPIKFLGFAQPPSFSLLTTSPPLNLNLFQTPTLFHQTSYQNFYLLSLSVCYLQASQCINNYFSPFPQIKQILDIAIPKNTVDFPLFYSWITLATHLQLNWEWINFISTFPVVNYSKKVLFATQIKHHSKKQ